MSDNEEPAAKRAAVVEEGEARAAAVGGAPPPPPATGAGTGSAGSTAAGSAAEPTTQAVTMRVLLEAKDAGHIIGKKGATINQLRDTSKCNINISNSPEGSTSTERVLTVVGQPSEVFTAFFSICTKLQSEGNVTPGAPPPPLTLRLLIHKSQAGAIIGKQGSVIRQIKENCNVNLRMNDTCMPMSSERECQIIGDGANVAQAVNYIAALVQQSPLRGPQNFYKPELAASVPQNPFIAATYDPLYANLMQQNQQQHPGHQHPQLHQAPAAMAQGAGSPNQIQLQIPNEIAGAIIGPKGTKIAEIRQMSQASVRIGERTPGAASRPVIINGTPEACRLAVTLINQRINEHQVQHSAAAASAAGGAAPAPGYGAAPGMYMPPA